MSLGDRLRRSHRFGRLRRRLLRAARFTTSAPEKALLHVGLRAPLGLPGAVILGMPKAATWWLAHHLERHPGVFLGMSPEPGKGEIRYFSLRFDRSLAYYERIFDGAAGRLTIDKSPDYCLLSDRRLTFLHRCNPDVRAILLLREPVERAFSHAKMDLLRSRGRRIDQVDFAEFERHYRRTSALFDYEGIVAKLRRNFGDRLLLQSHADVARAPRTLLEVTMTFLHLDPAEYPWEDVELGTAINATERGELPERHRALLASLNARNVATYERLTAVDHAASSSRA